MKKTTIGIFIVLVVLCSCETKKKAGDSDIPKANHPKDSMNVSNPSDSFSVETEELETPKPEQADGLFDDFIYRFADNDKLQRQRIIFPLPYYTDDTPAKIEKSEWKHDSIFAGESYITLFHDKEEDPEAVSDTSLTSVQVNRIFMDTQTVKRYYFERIKKVWMLEAVNIYSLEKRPEEYFLKFFIRFAADSLFQRQHIREPLIFITTDPDDEFAIAETTLEVDQWYVFKPDFPTGNMININYGKQIADKPGRKIVELKGIGNGFSNTLYFRRKNNEWELYKFEDTGI